MNLRAPVCLERVAALLALTLGTVTAIHPNISARAQAWPSRTVTVVVPFGPGNALETVGRPVLDGLSKRLGKPFVIENRAGAGSATGAAYAARAVPDGHTILFHSSTLSILHSVQPRRTYDTLNDFVPVVPLGAQPTLLITSTSKGIKSAQELIAAAKARPGAMNFASAGPGSTSHVAAERFRLPAGIDAKHVPFRAPSDALTETITGRIDFYFPPISVALPLVRDGKLAALAVSTKARAAALPDVPTTTELGLKDSAFEFWTGFLLPAKTPRDIVLKLNAETRSVLETPTIQARLKSFGYAPMNMTPEEFAKFFRDDIDDLAKSIKAAGIKAN
jgi:tripartite-type tricarboxylate transporter receptor subunit TctC